MTLATSVYFHKHENFNGLLCAYESGRHIPFDIRRVFIVTAKAGDKRGEHAHKQCTQLLVCISGKIIVICDDGSSINQHVLDNVGTGLLIPNGIWAEQEYMVDGAVLMVLCDRGYEEEDYIRNYDDFKAFIGTKE
jgi:dTDP-4-dehydrorhamnose 3,5-epimerase-like enzyme